MKKNKGIKLIKSENGAFVYYDENEKLFYLLFMLKKEPEGKLLEELKKSKAKGIRNWILLGSDKKFRDLMASFAALRRKYRDYFYRKIKNMDEVRAKSQNVFKLFMGLISD